MLAVVLALGSSACYGVSNFVGPQLARRHTLVAVLVWSQLAALIGCIVYLAAERGAPLPAPMLLIAVLAGLANAGGLIWFYKAAQLGPLSVVAPIAAVGVVIPVVWGVGDGDALHALQIGGIVLAIGGATLAARREADEDPTREYPDPRGSVVYAVLAAMAFGVFLTALPKASEDAQAWALFDTRVVLLIVVAIWAGRSLATLRPSAALPKLAVPGMLLFAGTILYVVAAHHGQLSVVSVAASLQPVFTVALGVSLLGERLSRPQGVGVAAALGGIVLIAT